MIIELSERKANIILAVAKAIKNDKLDLKQLDKVQTRFIFSVFLELGETVEEWFTNDIINEKSFKEIEKLNKKFEKDEELEQIRLEEKLQNEY